MLKSPIFSWEWRYKMRDYNDKKIIIATTIGSAFELFDFLSFVFLSPIIAKLFFPPQIHNLAIIFTYLTITMSYLLRPIGGLVLAHLGDRYGRIFTFTTSILLMSIPSFTIGILPTFSSIGYAATFLLIFARILQGLSLGGEVPASITYIAEEFKTKNYYFYCAWLTFGANIGVAIGSQAVDLLSQFTSTQFMYSIGWRIPFLIGSLLTIIGFYIRRTISESNEFKQLQRSKNLSTAPLITILKQYRPQIICGILLSVIVSLTTSIFHIFLPSLLTNYSRFSLNTTTNISTIGAVTMALFSLLFAYCVKYIPPINILRIGLMSLIITLGLILAKVLTLGDVLHQNIAGLYIIVILISIALSGVNGVLFGLLAGLFPTQVRLSGVSFCFNIAYIFGAGITPIWTSSVIQLTGSYNIIIVICLGVTLISLINTIFVKKLVTNTLIPMK